MILPEQFKDNPLIQADLQFRRQRPVVQEEQPPSQDQLVQLAKEGKISHMGGKLPDFLKGIVTEARDVAKKILRGGDNVIEVDNRTEEPNTEIDVNRVVEVLGAHESRGSISPTESIELTTGATGISQITPIMIEQYNQKTGNNVTQEQLANDPQLQTEMTRVLIEDILSKYEGGLDEDWPTHTKKLTAYKKEIKNKFNEPIYWIAGEWVAGPNWVAKLDAKTAPGAKETVRDYIQRVGDLYKGRESNLVLNK